MSRISGLRNDMNKRTLYKERKINKRYIHFLSKQSIKAPLILDMYGFCDEKGVSFKNLYSVYFYHHITVNLPNFIHVIFLFDL